MTDSKFNEPPIMEFSQDEIDLMIAALEWWDDRIDAELNNTRLEPIRSGHRAAGAYAKSRIALLKGKLEAW